MNAQTSEQLPFQEIPPTPKNYGAGNLITRMIDELGYRYYLPLDSFTKSDRKYKPLESGK
jgi:hypothetical protein